MGNTLHDKLQEWFKKNQRKLPWRNQSNWYKTYLSEILLQQTQVEQGLPYYHKFINQYPDIWSLSQAEEDEILRLWSGLGYYARARNMLKTAKIIVTTYDGNFPDNWQEALRLPGIGPYSAAAILSISFNKPFAVVDGNVQRVLSRLFTFRDDLRLSATQKKITETADTLLNKQNPGTHNEALMELGALVCLPKNPVCEQCPLKLLCKAYGSNLQKEIPFKSPPAKKKLVKQYILLMQYKDKFIVRQRSATGLLARMWEFPYLEVDELNLSGNQIREQILQEMGTKTEIKGVLKNMSHIYSHIRLEYVPLILKLVNGKSVHRTLGFEEMDSIALHRAHKKILELPELQHFFNN